MGLDPGACLRSLLLGAFCFLSFWIPGTTLASVEEPDTLVIGKISHNPKKHYGYLKPIAQYASEKMADLGYRRVKVLMAKDIHQMIAYLRKGRVDWVTATLMTAIELKEKANGELLVKKWKKGEPFYHSIFFTRKDSGIRSLDDLEGKRIAFEDPSSSSSFFFPAELLLHRGYSLVRLENARQPPPEDAIGYTFAREEINITTWVYKGLVDVGVINDHDWKKEDHLPLIFRRDMRVLEQTEDYPRAIEVIRSDLPVEVKERLRSILLEAHRDPDATGVLRSYQETERFELLPADFLQTVDELTARIEFVRSRLRQ